MYVFYPSGAKLFGLTNLILKKFEQPLIFPRHKVSPPHKLESFNDLFLHWHVNQFNVRQLVIPQHYKKLVADFLCNPQQRFFAFVCILHNIDSITYHTHPGTSQWEHCTHATVIVYDKHWGYLERYDSANNMYMYDSHLLDTVIISTFNNTFNYPTMKMEIKGINTPHMICPNGGIQNAQEKEAKTCATFQNRLGVDIGFCSVYMLLYLEKRLEHQSLTPKQVMELIYESPLQLHLHTTPLTKYIRKYAYDLDTQYMQMMEKTRSVSKASLSFGDYSQYKNHFLVFELSHAVSQLVVGMIYVFNCSHAAS